MWSHDSTPRPPPSPFSISWLSLFLSLPLCRRSSLLMGEGERGWAKNQTKSYDREKPWPSIIHPILSGMKRWFEILYSMFGVFLYNKRKSFGEKYCFIVSWLCPFTGKIISSEILEKPAIKKILIRISLLILEKKYFVKWKTIDQKIFTTGSVLKRFI